MATPNQLASQIRFQLEQLSERNAHHDFEHLCRWLARNRICSNILPATGPVSAYGDQGRDFETFRTYLHQSSIGNSSFIGLASEGPIAFACTLERELARKIKSDINTITESGTPVIDIHYFCAGDLPAGQRHKLQAWAKKEKNVLLEIHDGQAISEYLSEQDLFWLAVEFLKIPAEIFPNPPSERQDQWYQEISVRWKEQGQTPQNYADFADLKAAIRHATFTEALRKDLSFWINQMQALIDVTPYDELKRKAKYEILVASLRGFGSLIGHESEVEAYFEEVSNVTALSELEDATNLRNYCWGAYHRNDIQISAAQLSRWGGAIAERIESELIKASQPGIRCFLLQIRGLLNLFQNPVQQGTIQLDDTIQNWVELAHLVEKAPLFPLERFSDLLTELLKFIPMHSFLQDEVRFSELTQLIDEQLAKRYGGFVAAQKCRDRAMVYYENNQILQAIREIHKAKIQWFAKETLRGSLLASIMLSACYEKLGLHLAAKFYALASAYIGIQSSDASVHYLIPQALMLAANCDYSVGAYLGFLDLTEIGIGAINVFSGNMDLTDPENGVSNTLLHATMLRIITKRLSPEILKLVDERMGNWGEFGAIVKELIPASENTWMKQGLDELWLALEEQTYGRPLSDVGQLRSIEFEALGILWKFEWENSYDLTPLAEELAATIQVLLAEIGEGDWVLVRATVEVSLSIGGEGKIEIREIPSNEIGRWQLNIPGGELGEETREISLALATALLHHASLLPTDKFHSKLDEAFQGGLVHKLFFGQRYDHLYRYFISREWFDRSNRQHLNPPEPDRSFISMAKQGLPWRGGQSASYREDDAKRAVKTRYEKLILPIGLTLKRLNQEPSFQEAIRLLRIEGWLDWHILMAIASIVINYRVNKEIDGDRGMNWAQMRWNELIYKTESEDDILVPAEEFSVDKLKFGLHLSMISTLMNLGLELHQRTPDFKAISDFLRERFNYWSDDVPHPNYGLQS